MKYHTVVKKTMRKISVKWYEVNQEFKWTMMGVEGDFKMQYKH